MAVHVRYYAKLRELMGRAEEDVPHAADLTGRTLIDHVAAGDAEKRAALLDPAVKFDLNGAFASLDDAAPDGSEVAFLPPFSGG